MFTQLNEAIVFIIDTTRLAYIYNSLHNNKRMTENFFDVCTNLALPINNLTSVTCGNFLNDQNYFIVSDVNKDIANCKYHQCIINTDFAALTKTSVSCSGVIVRYGTDSYYNPLVDKAMIMSKVKQLPRSIIDSISSNLDYFYFKDVRTSFDKELDSVTCSDHFSTTLKFSDGTTVTWGNTDNTRVHHGFIAFITAFGLTLLAYIIVSIVFTYGVEKYFDIGSTKQRNLKLFIYILMLFLFNSIVLFNAVVDTASFAIGVSLMFVMTMLFEFRKSIARFIG